MKRIIAAALFASMSTSATAAEPEGQGYGLGMKSCTAFASDYKTQPTVTESLYFAWAEGFLSGLNLSATANNLSARSLASINMESAKTEIREYCDEHPLAAYYEVLITIYNRLPSLPKNSN